MKIGELRQKSKTELPKEAKVKMRTKFSSPTELQKLLSEKGERLRNLRFDLASGKVKNVREIREIKKDIARTLTLLNNK